MICHNCGRQVPDESKFCDNCGTSLSVDMIVSSTPEVMSNPFAERDLSSSDSNVAAILSFLFGPLGFHDFYCGNLASGLIKFVLTITGVAAIVSVVWNLIDLYNIADGNYMDGDSCFLEAAPWAKVMVVFGIFWGVAVAAGALYLVAILCFFFLA